MHWLLKQNIGLSHKGTAIKEVRELFFKHNHLTLRLGDRADF